MSRSYRLAYLSVFFTLISLSFLTAVQPVSAVTEEENWLEMEKDTFVIEYKEGYQEDASDIAEMGENAYM